MSVTESLRDSPSSQSRSDWTTLKLRQRRAVDMARVSLTKDLKFALHFTQPRAGGSAVAEREVQLRTVWIKSGLT